MRPLPPPILPGATLGVLGSGQLGRMFALAARRMGYRVHVFSPDRDSPAGQVADHEVSAAYEDLDQVRAFARSVGAVTFEFENVAAATAAACAELTILRPAGAALHITQNRQREKDFLAGAGLPVTPFAAVSTAAELEAALVFLGTPAVLKTAAFGYDGKGQVLVRSPAAAQAAWTAIDAVPAVLERFIDFERELSVVAARGVDGAFAPFAVFDNSHRDHILDLTLAPAELAPAVATEALDIARAALEALDLVGVMCVELFLTDAGRLYVNELAPRPHNSGHLTIEACVTSQFEQQVRTLCGLPLGDTTLLRSAAMANLLGDLWAGGEPDWAAACALAEVKLHLYGKAEPRPGRKMGHLTALAEDTDSARRRVLAARAALARAGA